jgi:hypothetical protein
LKSLLKKSCSKDSAEDFDDGEDLLPDVEKVAVLAVSVADDAGSGNNNVSTNQTLKSQDIMLQTPVAEEEKKEDFIDDDEDGQGSDLESGYRLPPSMSIKPSSSNDSNGDASATSNSSGAPSVAESIRSNMGWF